MSKKQGVCGIWRPSISSGFGCWATHTRNVCKRCGMQMSALQESFWRQKEKRRSDDGAYKAQFKRKRKRSEKYMQHDSKQSNRKGKITNQVRLTVLVLRSPEGNIRKQEGKEQLSAIIVAAMIIKGKAVHSVPSMYWQAKCLITLVCV